MKIKIHTNLKQIVIVPFVKNGEWDGIHWITLTDIDFEIDGKQYKIKAGFVSDMGSIPRVARMTVDRMGKSLVGFIIHDWLYTPDSPLSRKQADMILYLVGRMYGESWYTANKIYYACRSFGWTASRSPNEYQEIDGKTVFAILLDNVEAIENLLRGKWDAAEKIVFENIIHKYKGLIDDQSHIVAN